MKKRQVIGILIFFLIFLVMLIPVSYVLRPEDGDTKATFSGFYAEKNNTLDMMFYGSSAAYRYISSPQIWHESGLTSYVLGSPSQPFSTVQALITETEKSQSPKLYVVEIRSLITTDYNLKHNLSDGTETSHLRAVTDNLLYSSNRVNLINDSVDGSKNDWYFDIIYNHSNWKSLTLGSLSQLFYHKKSDVKGAYTADMWQSEKKFDTTPYAGEKTALEDSTEQTLLDFLDFCKTQDLNVLFVSTPYIEDKFSITEENYIADLIKNYGFSYLNCNYDYQDIGLNFRTDFYNDKHTNVLGAIKVTDYLLKYIQDHYDITSTHTDKTIADWDKAYETWSEQAKAQEKAVKAEIKGNKS